MKKVFMVLSLLGMFTFIAPKVATSADVDCHTWQMVCEDTGIIHYIVVCDQGDWAVWAQELCGAGIE